MKKLFLVSLIVVQACMAFAQNFSVDESVYASVDIPPHYLNGGDKGLLSDLYTIISETAPFSQDSVKGRAVVSFSVSKDGQIDTSSIKVIRNRSVPDDYLKAAIEAIKKLGKFEPGKQLGTPKRVTYTIPVIYPAPPEYIKTNE